jgi:hypothetical protein
LDEDGYIELVATDGYVDDNDDGTALAAGGLPVVLLAGCVKLPQVTALLRVTVWLSWLKLEHLKLLSVEPSVKSPPTEARDSRFTLLLMGVSWFTSRKRRINFFP